MPVMPGGGRIPIIGGNGPGNPGICIPDMKGGMPIEPVFGCSLDLFVSLALSTGLMPSPVPPKPLKSTNHELVTG